MPTYLNKGIMGSQKAHFNINTQMLNTWKTTWGNTVVATHAVFRIKIQFLKWKKDSL